MPRPEPLRTIIDFVRSIGIDVTEQEIHRPTLVPGIDIQAGRLVVDEARMCQPADLLHEAAHIALTSPDRRATLDGTISSTPAEEMSAIGWTWAAAKHLCIDPAAVFHDEVISGNGPTLLENFSSGRYLGVPMLQYWGMTREKPSAETQISVYPHMMRWMRDERGI
jgi:hypothetical protein